MKVLHNYGTNTMTVHLTEPMLPLDYFALHNILKIYLYHLVSSSSLIVCLYHRSSHASINGDVHDVRRSGRKFSKFILFCLLAKF